MGDWSRFHERAAELESVRGAAAIALAEAAAYGVGDVVELAEAYRAAADAVGSFVLEEHRRLRGETAGTV